MKMQSPSPFGEPSLATSVPPVSLPTRNGSPSPEPHLSSAQLPPQGISNGEPLKPRKKRRGPSLALVGGIAIIFVICIAVGGYILVKYGRVFESERNDLLFHVVKKEALLVTIVDKGQLEAAENRDE